MKKAFYNYISSICIVFTLSFLLMTFINRLQNYIAVSNDFILFYFCGVVLAESIYILITRIHFQSYFTYHMTTFLSIYMICLLFFYVFQFIKFSFHDFFIYSLVFTITYISVYFFLIKKYQLEADHINSLIQKYNDHSL